MTTKNLPAMYGDGHCAVCQAKTRRGNLMCPAHWRKVPKPLKDAVYDALHRWDAGTATLGDLRAAQEAAIAAVKP